MLMVLCVKVKLNLTRHIRLHRRNETRRRRNGNLRFFDRVMSRVHASLDGTMTSLSDQMRHRFRFSVRSPYATLLLYRFTIFRQRGPATWPPPRSQPRPPLSLHLARLAVYAARPPAHDPSKCTRRTFETFCRMAGQTIELSCWSFAGSPNTIGPAETSHSISVEHMFHTTRCI